MAERKVINGFIVERQPNGAIVTIGPAPTAQSGPAVTRVPAPAQAVAKDNLDNANTNSQMTSRGVSDVNTNANTGKTVVETTLKQLDLDDALKNRARGVVVEDAATQEVRNQLMAVRNARQYNNEFSTGTVGNVIGAIPLLGGTSRDNLEAALGTIRSGAKFNMIQTLKERGAAQGAQGTGLGATAIPEFEALGRVNFNLEPDALSTNPQFVTGELDKAEETLLRRYAAVTLPSDVLVGATREQRQALLDASYEQAKREYLGGFAPGGADQGGGGQGGNGGGGGVPSLTPENMSRGPQTIGKTELKLLPDPAKKGLNTTVQGMIRNGSSASEIISLLETRGVPMSDVLVSTVQRNVEAYRPYAGKPLPKDLPDPRVSVEVQMEERPFLERVAGSMADTSYGAGAVGVANGFLLGGLDELASGGDPARMAQIDAYKRYTSENSPIASTLGNITGGIASFLPVGRGINAAAKATQLSPTVARLVQGGANVAMGATAGALENNEDRTTGALIGGGAALGGDLAGNYIGGKFAGRLAQKPSGADDFIAESTVNPDTARGVLAQGEELGLPTTLMDADLGLSEAGTWARTKSANARSTIDDTLEARADGAKSRAVLAVENNLSPRANITKVAKDIRGAARVDAAPMKERAFAQQPPVNDPVISDILKTDTGKKALAFARSVASDERRDPDEIGLVWEKVTGPDETITRTVQRPGLLGEAVSATEEVKVPGRKRDQIVALKGSSWETLDYMRRGIDMALDERRDQITGKLIYDRGGKTKAIEGLRADFANQMRKTNPEYGAYVDTLSGPYSNAEHIGLGSKFMSRDLNAAQLGELVKEMNPDQLAHYRIGAANEVIDKIENGGSNWNMLRAEKSIGLNDKLRVLFPGENIDKIDSLAKFERTLQKTRDSLSGNSATNLRGEVVARGDAVAAPGLGGVLAEGAISVGTGGVSSLLTSLARAGRLGFKDANVLQKVRNQEALANDLAPILAETDPKKAKAALDRILGKVDTYNKVKATSKDVGRSVGAATATGILAQ